MVIEQTYNRNFKNGEIVLGLHGPDEKTPENVLLSIGPVGCSTTLHMSVDEFIKLTKQMEAMWETITILKFEKEVA